MNMIVVDDEKLVVDNILSLLRKVEPEAVAVGFTEPEDALAHLAGNRAEIAFLDIEMGEMDGISLAKKCKDLCPHINIIFVTGYSSYSLDAIRLHASGYLLKPVRADDLRAELDDLRHPLPLVPEQKLRVLTFGNFEVFYGNEILHFGRAKAKELFAYLIDRKGSASTMSELAAAMWEDRACGRSQMSQVRTFLAEIKSVLAQAGCPDVLIKKRNSVAINVEAVDCDYYRFLQGDVRTINTFAGEYMTNYSWAEFTAGNLTMRSNHRNQDA